jgi:hypothetical protein
VRVGDAICFRHKPFHGDPVVPFVSLQHWHHRKGRRLNTGQPIQPLREVFVYLQTARLWVSIKRASMPKASRFLVRNPGSRSRRFCGLRMKRPAPTRSVPTAPLEPPPGPSGWARTIRLRPLTLDPLGCRNLRSGRLQGGRQAKDDSGRQRHGQIEEEYSPIGCA